jgi:hypothetical protein
MKTDRHLAHGEARAGDWIEADAPGGGPAHRRLILEVLGTAQHEHYRVRWDEAHETIFYPADGARIIRAGDD